MLDRILRRCWSTHLSVVVGVLLASAQAEAALNNGVAGSPDGAPVNLKIGAQARPEGKALPSRLTVWRLERRAPSAAYLSDFTLPRAVEQAVQTHPSIGTALATLAKQTGEVEVARAGYRPQVRAGLAAGRQAAGNNTQQLALTASQLLYDFGKVDSTVNQASAAERQQKARVLQQVDDVARDTALAVVEVLRYQRLEQQSKELVESLRDIVKLTELRSAAGATTVVDPITARARLEAAQAGLLSVGSQLRQQRNRLQTLTSSTLPSRLPPLSPEATQVWLRYPVPDVNDLPAVQLVQAELEQNQALLDKTRVQQMPNVTLDAGLQKPLGGSTASRSLDHTIMVNFTSSLYQGGAQGAQVEAATYGVLSAKAKIASTRLDWLERQQQYSEQARSLSARFGVLASRQSKLQDTRALYREQYLSLGTRSVLDLLNTEQEIFQAMADHVNAQHDLWVAQFQSLHSQGQMRQAFALRRVQGQDLEP